MINIYVILRSSVSVSVRAFKYYFISMIPFVVLLFALCYAQNIGLRKNKMTAYPKCIIGPSDPTGMLEPTAAVIETYLTRKVFKVK